MEKSKSLLLYLILFSFAFINFNCNTAEPIQNIVETGSRDYSWTIDTINSGSLQTYLTSIWGSSSKDVWICGHDANNLTKIYHFDGTEWKPRIDIPATYYIKSYSEVTGIDSNLVIFVGGAYFINNTPPPNFLDSSLIMKFTNNNWEINVVENSYHIYSVCITSENNIWAGDGKGNLIHFDGNNWTITKLGYENLLINEIEALNIYNSRYAEYVKILEKILSF